MLLTAFTFTSKPFRPSSFSPSCPTHSPPELPAGLHDPVLHGAMWDPLVRDLHRLLPPLAGGGRYHAPPGVLLPGELDGAGCRDVRAVGKPHVHVGSGGEGGQQVRGEL